MFAVPCFSLVLKGASIKMAPLYVVFQYFQIHHIKPQLDSTIDQICQQFQHWEVDLEVNSRHCVLNFKWKKKNLVK